MTHLDILEALVWFYAGVQLLILIRSFRKDKD